MQEEDNDGFKKEIIYREGERKRICRKRAKTQTQSNLNGNQVQLLKERIIQDHP